MTTPMVVVLLQKKHPKQLHSDAFVVRDVECIEGTFNVSSCKRCFELCIHHNIVYLPVGSTIALYGGTEVFTELPNAESVFKGVVLARRETAQGCTYRLSSAMQQKLMVHPKLHQTHNRRKTFRIALLQSNTPTLHTHVIDSAHDLNISGTIADLSLAGCGVWIHPEDERWLADSHRVYINIEQPREDRKFAAYGHIVRRNMVHDHIHYGVAFLLEELSAKDHKLLRQSVMDLQRMMLRKRIAPNLKHTSPLFRNT